MNLVPCQKQLECQKHILSKIQVCICLFMYYIHLATQIRKKPMKILAKTGGKGEPMATPTT